MPRLSEPDPSTTPDEVRAFLAPIPPDPLVKLLSHATGTVVPYISFARTLFSALELPAHDRELVILTVAEWAAGEFVAAQHGPISANAGVTEPTRRAIRERRPGDPALPPRSRALLRLTAEIVQHPRAPDEVFAAARQHLSEREIVEVLQVAGYYWSFCRACTTLDIELTTIYTAETSEG